jgi:hypothetical protein
VRFLARFESGATSSLSYLHRFIPHPALRFCYRLSRQRESCAREGLAATWRCLQRSTNTWPAFQLGEVSRSCSVAPVSWLRVGCAAWACQPCPLPLPPLAPQRAPPSSAPLPTPTYAKTPPPAAACTYLPPLGQRGKVCPWVYPWKRDAAQQRDRDGSLQGGHGPRVFLPNIDCLYVVACSVDSFSQWAKELLAQSQDRGCSQQRQPAAVIGSNGRRLVASNVAMARSIS